MMSPSVRKAALTAHVVSSVGWLGAVASFLVLALAGMARSDPRLANAFYVAMNEVTWAAIVPLCAASLLTGLVSSLGTPWGLFRHYWVIVKLVVTVLASLLLLVHTRPISWLSQWAASGAPLPPTDLSSVRVQLVADAVAAVFALLIVTVVSIYKPKGVTRYGERAV